MVSVNVSVAQPLTHHRISGVADCPERNKGFCSSTREGYLT